MSRHRNEYLQEITCANASQFLIEVEVVVSYQNKQANRLKNEFISSFTLLGPRPPAEILKLLEKKTK